jgi:hypothetical protein
MTAHKGAAHAMVDTIDKNWCLRVTPPPPFNDDSNVVLPNLFGLVPVAV